MADRIGNLIINAEVRGAREARRRLDALGTSARGAERAGSGLNNQSQQTSRGIAAVGGSSVVATAAIVGLGVGFVSLARNASQASRSLSQAVAETSTLIQGTAQQIASLTAESAMLAAIFGGTATAQAQAFYAAYSAGARDAAEATAIVVAANMLAIGGVATLEASIQLLTGTLNAYSAFGLDASRVTDIFFEVVKNGITTIPQLAQAFSTVSGVAANFGVALESAGSALAAITATGVVTNQAATQVRSFLLSLQRLNEEQIAFAMNLGVTSTAPANFVNIIRQLRRGLSGFSNETEKASALFNIFGAEVEAFNAVLALTGGGFNTFERALLATNNSAGATAEAFDKISDSAEQRLRVALGQVHEAQLLLGNEVNRLLIPAYETWGTAVGETAGFLGALNTVIGESLNSLNEEAEGGTSFFDRFTDFIRTTHPQAVAFFEVLLSGAGIVNTTVRENERAIITADRLGVANRNLAISLGIVRDSEVSLEQARQAVANSTGGITVQELQLAAQIRLTDNLGEAYNRLREVREAQGLSNQFASRQELEAQRVYLASLREEDRLWKILDETRNTLARNSENRPRPPELLTVAEVEAGIQKLETALLTQDEILNNFLDAGLLALETKGALLQQGLLRLQLIILSSDEVSDEVLAQFERTRRLLADNNASIERLQSAVTATRERRARDSGNREIAERNRVEAAILASVKSGDVNRDNALKTANAALLAQSREYAEAQRDILVSGVEDAADATARALVRSEVSWRDWGRSLEDIAKQTVESIIAQFTRQAFLNIFAPRNALGTGVGFFGNGIPGQAASAVGGNFLGNLFGGGGSAGAGAAGGSFFANLFGGARNTLFGVSRGAVATGAGTSVLGSIAQAIPTIAIAAAVLGVLNSRLFQGRQTADNTEVSVAGDRSITANRITRNQTSILAGGRYYTTVRPIIGEELQEIDRVFTAIGDIVSEAANAIGGSVGTFSTEIRGGTSRLREFGDVYADFLARQVLGYGAVIAEGDTALGVLSRIVGSFTSLNAALEGSGFQAIAASVGGAFASDDLIRRLGVASVGEPREGLTSEERQAAETQIRQAGLVTAGQSLNTLFGFRSAETRASLLGSLLETAFGFRPETGADLAEALDQTIVDLNNAGEQGARRDAVARQAALLDPNNIALANAFFAARQELTQGEDTGGFDSIRRVSAGDRNFRTLAERRVAEAVERNSNVLTPQEITNNKLDILIEAVIDGNTEQARTAATNLQAERLARGRQARVA